MTSDKEEILEAFSDELHDSAIREWEATPMGKRNQYDYELRDEWIEENKGWITEDFLNSSEIKRILRLLQKTRQEERERIREGITKASKFCRIDARSRSFPKRDEYVHTDDIFAIINNKEELKNEKVKKRKEVGEGG